jgi:hypothetical protein
VVAILCTHRFGLGEAAVFGTIAAGNLVSAAGMVALFSFVARRLRGPALARGVPAELATTAGATNG